MLETIVSIYYSLSAYASENHEIAIAVALALTSLVVHMFRRRREKRWIKSLILLISSLGIIVWEGTNIAASHLSGTETMIIITVASVIGFIPWLWDKIRDGIW